MFNAKCLSADTLVYISQATGVAMCPLHMDEMHGCALRTCMSCIDVPSAHRFKFVQYPYLGQ